jgi:hypothetical protein
MLRQFRILLKKIISIDFVGNWYLKLESFEVDDQNWLEA